MRTTSCASRTRTAAPETVLVDARPLQGGHAGAWEALLQARPPGVVLHGLIDPDGPALPDTVRAWFDSLHPNAYAARRPDCLVRLSPSDPLFIARLIQTVPTVALASALPSDPLEREVAAYWLRRSDAVVDPADLWATVARVERPGPQGQRMAVFVHDPADALAQALRRRGARVFGAEPVALLSPRFARTLFIVEGTPAEARLLRLLRRFGGDVVLTGTCLLGAYGDATAAALAAAELGRAIPPGELAQWRQGIARPGALFLGEVAAAARTLFVPSDWLAREVATRYGRDATVLPVAADTQSAGRPGTIAASAAGLQAEACVWALELLRCWAVEARMVLDCPAGERDALTRLAAALGVADRLGFGPEPSAVTAVLAMRGDGRPVGPLVAALGGRCVATRGLAEAIDPPSWLDIVPDQASPPLLAAALRTALAQPPPASAAWANRHAPDAVAAALE